MLTNLGRATDRRHPQDGLLYSTLVASYFVLHSLLAEGLLDDADRDLVAQVEGSFSYVCSGPPPERLGNLLALHRAGVVRFLGPDTRFRRNPGAGPRFLADSPVVVGDPVTADHLVDARLAQVTVPRVTDPVLRGLLADGELVAGTGASGAADPGLPGEPAGRGGGGGRVGGAAAETQPCFAMTCSPAAIFPVASPARPGSLSTVVKGAPSTRASASQIVE